MKYGTSLDQLKNDSALPGFLNLKARWVVTIWSILCYYGQFCVNSEKALGYTFVKVCYVQCPQNYHLELTICSMIGCNSQFCSA